MFCIQIADLVVEIQNRFSFVRELCREYQVEVKQAAFSVFATDEDIDKELDIVEGKFPRSYAEATCVHRKIAERLSDYQAFLLHSAVISCDGKGYAFAARSGVGKSTHISLWMKHFGERVCVVNGDKPILRLVDGVFYAYGTPWRGKEGMGENVSCPLTALCFLERGKENRIERVSQEEALTRLFSQVYLPNDASASAITLDLLDRFIRQTDFYLLHCNMEEEAASVAYEGMNTRK